MIIPIIIVTIGFLLFLLIIKYDDIMSFLKPQDYSLVTIMEMDNNVKTKLVKKSSELKFKFNDGWYNLFFPFIEKSKGIDQPPKFNRQPAIYRNGRLSQFFYVEGNENPMDFRQGTITGNPQIEEKLRKISITNLWTTNENDIVEMFKKNWIMIVIGIIIIFILINQGG